MVCRDDVYQEDDQVIPDTRLTPTRREIQVLRLIAAGLSNKQIALQLDIAECTVKNHLLNMFQRLGFCNRVHAVVMAFKQGWIALSEIEELTLGRVADFSESFPRRTVKQVGRAAARGMRHRSTSRRVSATPDIPRPSACTNNKRIIEPDTA